MVTKPLLATIFPGAIVENFAVVSIQHYPEYEEIHIHFDGKKTVPAEFSSRRVISHGFASSKKIQDYPLRGNAVYLHVRRRKWLDTGTYEILAKTYSIAFEGTQPTKEFVSFLKEAYRAHGLEGSTQYPGCFGSTQVFCFRHSTFPAQSMAAPPALGIRPVCLPAAVPCNMQRFLWDRISNGMSLIPLNCDQKNLRLLQIKHSGRLGKRAVIALDCCPNITQNVHMELLH